jgi:predicted nucleotidyltransferase
MDGYLEGSYKEYCSLHIFYFPKVVDTNFEDIKRIYPLKQNIVKQLYESEILRKLCDKIYVFGSGINMSCQLSSDIDLAIKLLADTRESRSKVSNIIDDIALGNFDLL